VLIVDDNIDSALTMAQVLEMLGYETRTVHDGLEAVTAAQAFAPDVVVLDIGLPRINGHEAARRIRQLPGGRDMMLVALSGWGQEDDLRKSAARVRPAFRETGGFACADGGGGVARGGRCEVSRPAKPRTGPAVRR
jgi:CheY-like chemotaxis protein